MAIQMGDLKLYTVEELADMLDIKETTVRKILRSKRIAGKKLAKRWYVSEEALKAYFSQEEPRAEAEKI